MLIDAEDPEKIKFYFLLTPLPFLKRVRVAFSYLFGGKTSLKTHWRSETLDKDTAVAIRHVLEKWLGEEDG